MNRKKKPSANLLGAIPEPKLFHLGSGIRLWVEKHPGALSSSFGAFFGIGSAHESESQKGLAHLVEHMLFKGSTRLSAEEISWNIEKYGGDLNAYTDREMICFHAWMPRDKWDVAAELVFEMILDARLDPDEFAKEREVVIQELRGIEESAEDEFWESFFEVLWPGDPLGRRIGAKSADVKRLKFEDLVGFLRKQFFCAPLTLVVVSPFDEQDVFHRLREVISRSKKFLWFKDFVSPKGREKRRKKNFSTKSRVPLVKPGVKVTRFPSDQVHLGFAFPGLSVFDKNETALSSLCTLLGGGSSSRLFKELRENHGLTYSAGAFHAPFARGGVVQGYFSTEKSKIFEATRLAGEVCRGLSKNLKAEDLDFLHSLLEGSIFMNFEGVVNRMENIGRQDLILGGPVGLQSQLDELKTLTDLALKNLAVRFGSMPQIYALGPLNAIDRSRLKSAWLGEAG